MKVKVLLFAIYRDLAGAGEVELEVPAAATAGVAVARLREMGAGFARLPERPVIAINQDYAHLDAPVRDGDEIALLPPVAGG